MEALQNGQSAMESSLEGQSASAASHAMIEKILSEEPRWQGGGTFPDRCPSRPLCSPHPLGTMLRRILALVPPGTSAHYPVRCPHPYPVPEILRPQLLTPARPSCPGTSAPAPLLGPLPSWDFSSPPGPLPSPLPVPVQRLHTSWVTTRQSHVRSRRGYAARAMPAPTTTTARTGGADPESTSTGWQGGPCSRVGVGGEGWGWVA